MVLDVHWTYCMFGAFLFGKEFFMKLSNGTEVITKPYREKDTEEIVKLIHRNFIEVNVKDYGEKAMAALSATHDLNWFKGIAEYAHVYVFWNENKIVGVGSISSFFWKPYGKYIAYYFCATKISWAGDWQLYH